MTTTTQVAVTGSLVQVEVLGGPDHGDPPVLTYRAHDELHVGQFVFVPAPGWIERVTGDERLPGRVVGAPETEASVPDPDTLRETIPLYGPEIDAEGFTNGRVATIVTVLQRQAAAFSEARRGLLEAAAWLEKIER